MKPVIATLIFSSLLSPTLSQAAEDTRACNQLGREIALRAAEEMTGSFSAEQRTQLALVAESVCLDFQVAGAQAGRAEQGVAAASNMSVSTAADAGRESAGVTGADSSDSSDEELAAEEKEDRSFLNLKLIDPDERVQRPGLKRR